MELEHDRMPISVTLVKPSAINTPYPEHARSYLEDGAPALPPPMYQPEVVARAILTCAEKPVRDVVVGGAGRAQILMGAIAPRLTDRLMEGPMWKQQKRYDMHHAPAGNLEQPQRDGRAHGVGRGRVMQSSAYTSAVLSDVTRLLPIAAGAIAIAASYRKWRPERPAVQR
jgi:hypothetical protein